MIYSNLIVNFVYKTIYRWDDLISNSKYFVKNFQIILRKAKDCDKITEFQRKPQHVAILDPDAFCLVVFRDKLNNLQSLTIDLSWHEIYLKRAYFVKFLRAVPNLKVLKVSDIIFDENIRKMEEFEKIRLNLLELHCNSNMIYIFECSTLKVLKLRWNCNLNVQRKSNVCEFVSQQKELKNFTLSCSNEFFGYIRKFNYKFQLKSFIYSSNFNFQDYKAFVTFLEPHKKSLQSLDIAIHSLEQSKKTIEEILVYVMRNLSNLQTLELETNINGNGRKIEIIPLHLSTCAAKSIERIGFGDIFHSVDDTKQLIDMLPKMKHISINSSFRKALGLLEYAATKPQLESLKIFNFDYAESIISFSNLKELSVHNFSSSEQAFNSFIARHANSLEKISFGNAAEIPKSTVNEISKCENLKYLSIDVSGYSLTLILSIFRDILNRSKPLTIAFKDYPSVVTFELPEDKIFWNN